MASALTRATLDVGDAARRAEMSGYVECDLLRAPVEAVRVLVVGRPAPGGLPARCVAY